MPVKPSQVKQTLVDKLKHLPPDIGSKPFASKGSCLRKVSHRSLKEARRQAVRINADRGYKGDDRVEGYECPHCKLFHVGTPWTGPKKPVTCIACGDTGKNSKGGPCWPCEKHERIKVQ